MFFVLLEYENICQFNKKIDVKHTAMKYSLLDLSHVLEGSSIQEAFHRTLDTAQFAETQGYERFWLAEHHNMISVASVATTILMGYVAANTKSIKVGSGGIMLPNHSPLAIAEQIGTLAQLYPGRIEVGLGRAPGSDQFTAQFLNPNFYTDAQKFPEQVQLLQQFMYNEDDSIKVRAYVAENTNVPMYILGSSTDSAYLSSSFGLPYAFASHFAPQQMEKALTIYWNEFESSEYLDKPYTMVCANVVICDTEDEAKYHASSFYRMFLGIIRNKREKIQPPNLNYYTEMTLDEHRYLNQMLGCTFIGTKEIVESKIKQFLQKYPVNELIVNCPVYSQEIRKQTLQSFAEIIRQF